MINYIIERNVLTLTNEIPKGINFIDYVLIILWSTNKDFPHLRFYRTTNGAQRGAHPN